MGNRQNLSPARNQKTTTKLTAIFQLSRSQSEDFTEKKLRGPRHSFLGLRSFSEVGSVGGTFRH
jgi:hypothetical protein